MKKINALLIAVTFLSSTAIAQTQTKGIIEENGMIKIVNVDLESQSSDDVIAAFYTSTFGNYIPNTMGYSSANNTITFLTSTNTGVSKIITISADNGEVKHDIAISGRLIGSVYLPKEDAIGAFIVEREFNAYRNNDESISFIKIDINSGGITGRKKLGFLSLNTPSIPFFGAIAANPKIDVKHQQTGISAPAYNGYKNQVVLMAQDVTGVNRLYVIDASTMGLVSQRRVQENVIDLDYNPATRSYKTIFYRDGEGGLELYVGDMDEVSHEFSNISWFGKQEVQNELKMIEDGAIKIDRENERVYIIKNTSSSTGVFIEVNIESNQIIASSNYPIIEKIDDLEFPYSISESTPVTAFSAIKIYPNPSTEGELNIATMYNDVAERVLIHDINGNVVKEVVIESGEDVNSINVSDLAPGLYIVDIQTQYQFQTRKLSIH